MNIRYSISRETEPFMTTDNPRVAEACAKAGFWVRSQVQ